MSTILDHNTLHMQDRQLRLALVFGAMLSAILVFAIIFPAQKWFFTLETFLPIHAVLEALAVLVSFGLFIFVWRFRQRLDLSYFGPLGIWFLAVGLLDLAHLFSYAGMPDFITPSGPNKAIYFWLAARFASALGLLAAVFHQHTTIQRCPCWFWLSIAMGFVLLSGWLVLFQPQSLPVLFDPIYGLSIGKILMEWLIIVLFGVAATTLALGQGIEIPQAEQIWFLTAIWILALGELFFTLYGSVSDLAILLGHIYKVIGYAVLLSVLMRYRHRINLISLQNK